MMKINKNLETLSILSKKKIIEYIQENNIKPGDRLPSESNFVEMMGVSRITVREALAQLKQEGIVYTIQGKGTFLKRLPIQLKSGLEVLKSVTEIMTSYDYIPKTTYLPTKIIVPDEEVREKLELNVGEEIVTYYRKRYVDGEVAVYGVDSIPINRFKSDVPDRLPRESMLEFLEKDLGYDIENAVTEIVPVVMNKNMADLLEVAKGTIFLLLNQVFYDSLGKPLIYSLDYFNTNVFKFIINRRKVKHDGQVEF